jgi:uncharacterized membrane protein YdjX (TVP38/TMEM64 family)
VACSYCTPHNRVIPSPLWTRTHRGVRFHPGENLLMFSLTGFVWSIPVAFLLVAIGSIAGESLLFLSFRHFLHSRIVQFRKEHEDNYGTIVQVINQHKRWMVFLIRLSAIPVHTSHLLRLKVGTFFNAIVFLNR